MKIYARNKNYNDVSASVQFINGVGETDKPHLIEWFKQKGYTVEEVEKCDSNLVIEPQNDEIEPQNDEVKPNFEDMTPNELREWAIQHGLGREIKNIRNKEKLLKIVRG